MKGVVALDGLSGLHIEIFNLCVKSLFRITLFPKVEAERHAASMSESLIERNRVPPCRRGDILKSIEDDRDDLDDHIRQPI